MSYTEQEQGGGRSRSRGGRGKAAPCSPLEHICVETGYNSDLENISDQLDVSRNSTEDTYDFDENLESATVFMWEEYKKTEVPQIESVARNLDDGKTCGECGRKFTRRRSRDDHVNTVHRKERKERHFHCDETNCGKKFVKAFDLKRHRQMVHMNEEFKCSNNGCDKIFKRKCTRDRHVRNTHEKRGRVKCEECDKTFYESRDLKGHMRRAHNEPLLECEVNGCNATFLAQSGLYKHKKTTHSSKT